MLLDLLINTVGVLLRVLLFLMLARVVVGWFVPMEEDSRIGSFLMMITEPIVMPVRALCAACGWFEDTPIDVPFLITDFILILLLLIFF